MTFILRKLKAAMTINNITASVDAYPTFRLVKASVVIRYAINEVSSPGPPDVIEYTRSNVVSLHKVKGMHKVITFFVMRGSVILKKLCTPFAPSTLAAS